MTRCPHGEDVDGCLKCLRDVERAASPAARDLARLIRADATYQAKAGPVVRRDRRPRPSGGYYCPRCRRRHMLRSVIGRLHGVYVALAIGVRP